MRTLLGLVAAIAVASAHAVQAAPASAKKGSHKPAAKAAPAAAPAAPAKPTVAVSPLEAAPDLIFTGKSVAQAFANEAAGAGYKVLGPLEVEEKLGREGTRALASCGDDAKCLAERGAKLGVDRVVGGWLEKRGTAYRVSLVHADARTGARLGALEREIPIASRRLQKDVAAGAAGLLAGEADATGVLRIATDVPGALVTVDDVPVGTTPISRTVKPGKHKIHVSRTGWAETDPVWVVVPANGVLEHRAHIFELPARDRPNESVQSGAGTKVQIVR
jgi:hypothetical protein